MPLFPLPVEEFGGLNLTNAPDEVGFSGAIDMLNVIIPRTARGALATRPGCASFTSTAATNLHPMVSSRVVLIAEEAARIASYDTTGALLSSQAHSSGGFAFTSQSTPSNTYAYAATSNVSPYRYDAPNNVWSQMTVAYPKGNSVAVTPWDNRLVFANTGGKSNSGGPAGASSSDSHLWFSNPGDASTWGANNFVQLVDQDPTPISGLAVWGQQLFVFKTNSLYVFYGIDTDSTGQPIFNYRRIAGNLGALFNRAVTVTPEGVYFISNRGLCFTTGGPARIVSRAVDALFGIGTPPSFYGGNTFTGRAVRLGSSGGYLYMSDSISTLVYDTVLDTFFPWTLSGGMYEAASWSNSLSFAGSGLMYPDDTYVSTSNGIRRLDATVTTDNGTAITSRYQSGFDNIAPPRRFAAHYLFGNTRKRIRKWKVTGSGTVSFSTAHDFGSPGTASTLTLGTSPAIKDRWHNIATRGQLLSYKLSSTSAWNVQKLTAYLAGSEPPLLGNPSDK